MNRKLYFNMPYIDAMLVGNLEVSSLFTSVMIPITEVANISKQ